ncbi:MAG: alpha/beta hydrolase [Ramlibacter sp.]|nr:alpha/beta hydrolase [Ramlibacter sp.]
MQIDADLHDFIDELQRELPPPRDPTDMEAHLARSAAIALRLPSVLVPVTSGDFKLRPAGTTLPARLHWPTGAHQPVLMAWFPGGGWATGTLDSHDGLCRQLAHDLGVAVVCVQLPPATPGPLLHSCEAALLALRTLLEGRAKLAVNPYRLLVGGDGSGAHAALQAAWRLCRMQPGSLEAVLGLCPLVKPDFNTASYVRCASSPVFSRADAIRAWQGFLQGRWDIWDERAVLMHGNAPQQAPPVTVLVAAEQDVAHDDAIQLHDWLRMTGARCEFFGVPRMTHDFARMQHASDKARKLMLDALAAFGEIARLKP